MICIIYFQVFFMCIFPFFFFVGHFPGVKSHLKPHPSRAGWLLTAGVLATPSANQENIILGYISFLLYIRIYIL